MCGGDLHARAQYSGITLQSCSLREAMTRDQNSILSRIASRPPLAQRSSSSPAGAPVAQHELRRLEAAAHGDRYLVAARTACLERDFGEIERKVGHKRVVGD